MTTTTLADALEREHRDIDAGIEAFINGSSDEATLAASLDALRRHIYLEEAFLFPPLRQAGMIGPIFVMVRDHGQMWQTMDAVGAGAPVGPLLQQLVVQLEDHNDKEEQILYTQADQVLSADASAELVEFLASGRLPDGWVCEAVR